MDKLQKDTITIVIALAIIVVIVVIIAKYVVPQNALDKTSAQISAVKANNEAFNPNYFVSSGAPLLDEATLTDIVAKLRSEFDSSLTRFTPLHSDAQVFDAQVRRATNKAQVSQINNLYTAQTGRDLISDVTAQSSQRWAGIGNLFLSATDQSSIQSALDYINSLQ